MDAGASLRQTVTHLFDAVRFADHANELEEAARKVEGDLETALNKTEALSEDLYNVLTSMKADHDPVLKGLSQQVQDFLSTAKDQAKTKLQKRAKEELAEYRDSALAEKDKALKSLEAFFASDPLPVVEEVTQAKLVEDIYEARSRCECEGRIRYEFGLAAQNSRLFHQPCRLSDYGYELKVPVRFSRGLLSKTRVAGFERLDQYVLEEAESSGGKLRAAFGKGENEAQIRLVTSGDQPDSFIGIDYSDKVLGVNVMNDQSLVAFVDTVAIRKAAADVASELSELAKKRVSLLRLSVDGEASVDGLRSRKVLDNVLEVMGPAYRSLVKAMMAETSTGRADDELTLEFLMARLKILGDELSAAVSRTLGITIPAV